MGLNIGATPITKLYVGTTPVTKLYLGSTLIWQPPATGPVNVIVNGTFTSTAGWTGFYSGKSVSGGKAIFAPAPAYDGISQPVTLTAGKYYELTFTISEFASGNVYPSFSGGTGRSGTQRTANGTFVERLLANTGNNSFYLMPADVSATLNLSNVSLVGPYDTATLGGA